jgi:SAM-dependent methyltransferase
VTEARTRLGEVLDPRSNAIAKEDSSWDHGYLDLLGEEAPESTGVTQNLMLTRAVPVIYERWWRPTLAWAAKGVTGPGMAEEVRIARLFLGLSHCDRVLDVACGPANFSRAFARAAGDDGLVVGIDASPTMLARGA